LAETAERFDCGATIDLGKVPLKYAAVWRPWEIYIQSQQERMLLTVHLKTLKKVMDIFEKEDV